MAQSAEQWMRPPTSRFSLVHAAQANDICASVTVERLSSIGGVQSGKRMIWIAAMVLDMTYQVTVLVCDLHIAKVGSHCPISYY